MRYTLNKFIYRTKIAFTAVVVALLVGATTSAINGSQSQMVGAAAPALYFDPSSINVLKGDQFTIRVKANGTNFNAAQLDVAYDPSSLTFVRSKVAGSALPNIAVSEDTKGLTSLAIYNFTPASGDGLFLASYTFTALKSSGTSTISLANSSSLQSEGNQIAGGKAQSTVKFSSMSSSSVPVPTPEPKPVPVPAPEVKPAPVVTPTPEVKTTPEVKPAPVVTPTPEVKTTSAPAPAPASNTTAAIVPPAECKPGIPEGDARCEEPCEYDSSLPANSPDCKAPENMPETGPTSIAALFGATSAFGAISHRMFLKRRLR